MILYNDFTLALSTDNKALFVASAHTIHMKQHGSKSVEMNPCEHRVHPRQPTQFNDNRSKENSNNALTLTISAFPLFLFSHLLSCFPVFSSLQFHFCHHHQHHYQNQNCGPLYHSTTIIHLAHDPLSSLVCDHYHTHYYMACER